MYILRLKRESKKRNRHLLTVRNNTRQMRMKYKERVKKAGFKKQAEQFTVQ